MLDDRDRRIAKLEEELADLRTLVKALLADNARLRAENTQLRAENEELRRRLGQNSSNSSKPPSGDSPADRGARLIKPGSGKKPGGQPGHKGSRREFLAPTVPPVDCFPESCRRCFKKLKRRRDPNAIRHQTVDVPKIVPVVRDWWLHRGQCDCGEITCAQLPPGVPRGMCEPGLIALIALLTGDYNVGRRRAVTLLSDLLGIEISLGALSEAEAQASEAVAEPVEAVRQYVAEQPVKNTDATGWLQGGKARTLWTIATPLATFFGVCLDGTMPRLRALFAKIRGILISDRGTQFGFWAMDQRQICWAHLIRLFVAFAERSGPAGVLGENLLICAQSMIHAWHRVRDGTMSRRQFGEVMARLGPVIEGHLDHGVRLGISGVSGSCQNILKHRQALWTFVQVRGVEPTNNGAERSLRAFVLWRKRSFGSQSDRGTIFAARLMTVTQTLRKQNRHVLSYLTAACHAALHGKSAPSLLPLAIPTP